MKALSPAKIRFAVVGSFFLLSAALLVSCATKPAVTDKYSGATPLQWSQRMADSEMARRGDALAWKQGGKAKWDYTAGLFTLSLLKLNEVAPSPGYVRFADEVIGSFVDSNGVVKGYKVGEYQLDAVNPAKTLLLLWQTQPTADPRYTLACAKFAGQFDEQPRTPDGGFWHKERYTNQMWLDGLYMAAPFYAAMGQYLKNPQQAYDEVARQIRLMDAHTYDAATGLNYHGWDAAKIQPWANPVTGCSSNFWGRGEGWYAMALVDTLDFFPKNHPERADILATFQKTAAGILKWQDEKSGVWWQVLDQGGRPGNYLEATASAMFVYALARGVNEGYLPREYIPAIQRAYAGLIENFLRPDADGRWKLIQCCSVAGLGFKNSAGQPRDGTFNYYISEPIVDNDLKGVGPFILAGIEMQQLK